MGMATMMVAQKPTAKLPVRTVCRDGDVRFNKKGDASICHFDHWDSGGGSGTVKMSTITTAPLTTTVPNKWCAEGNVVMLGEDKFICYHDNYEWEKTLDQFEVHSLSDTPRAMDVPAVSSTTDTSFLRRDPKTNEWVGFLETRYKCTDSARVLLTSEDGVKHCILFPTQQPEVTTKGK